MLDTGVAYASRRGYRRSPDLLNRFVKGYDFVDGDAYPDDLNGHGTHVASTIAETTGNGYGLTGLAYGARIMPVRVLDRSGTGDSVAISAGIRYAARRGAKIINLSFEFDSSVTRGQIPDILDALRYARRKGALVVGASGNFSARARRLPGARDATCSPSARRPSTSARPTTRTPAPASTSPAPAAASTPTSPGDPNCRPGLEPVGRDIFQVTYTNRSVRSLRAAERLRRHLDGRAARVGDGGAHHRLRRDRRRSPTPRAGRGAPEGDGPRPRHARAATRATARGLVDAARAVTP